MKLTAHLTNMNIKLNAPYHTALGGEDGPRCRYEGFSQGPHRYEGFSARLRWLL
jgi:hypothetical protein